MHQYQCPSCKQALPTEQINVAKSVAHCLGCGKLSSLGDVMDFQEVQEQVKDTPSGCFVWEEGSRIRVQATLRSISGAIGALIISLFWNGLVSIFVVIAITGLWTHLVRPLPEWLPAPKMKDGKGIPLEMALFLCLFLTPFVLVGSCLIAGIFLNLWGKVEVILDGRQGSVRISVGILGWTRRFNAAAVTKVDIGLSTWQVNDQSKELICIQADHTIKFGTMLIDKRREWMRSVLKKLLVTH